MSISEVTIINIPISPVLGTGFIQLQGNGIGATLSGGIPISWVQYPNIVILTIHGWTYNIGGTTNSTFLNNVGTLPASIKPTYNLVNIVKLNINGTDNFACTCEISSVDGSVTYHNFTNNFGFNIVAQTPSSGFETFVYEI